MAGNAADGVDGQFRPSRSSTEEAANLGEGRMNDVLGTVVDAMVPVTASVTSRDTVAAAAKIIHQDGLNGLPVVDEGRLVGLVTPAQLLNGSPYLRLGNLMTPGVVPATPDMPLLHAYALMTRQKLEWLPVIEDGKVIGQVGATAILRKQSQYVDPLTDLPSSAALRSWATAALARGHEVAILFIDLDNFGIVNKALSHVAGDDTLCSVANLLRGLVHERTDLLCRYGGDEFAIATIRREADARALMQQIQDTVVLPIDVTGSMRQVTVSVGLAGGRRVEGRQRAHIAATVEDLLVLASRSSTAAKESKRAAESAPGAEAAAAAGTSRGGEHERPREARLRLLDVQVQTSGTGSSVTVKLKLGSREGTGLAAGAVHGLGTSFLAAEAALDAVRQTTGEEQAYVLEGLTEVAGAEPLALVVLAKPGTGNTAFHGSARASDLPRAVTKAILDALNRPLGPVLREQLAHDDRWSGLHLGR